MRIIALSTVKAFWEEKPEYQDSKEPTFAWHRHALHANWNSPAEVKQDFRNASILKDGRVVYNIAGNKYRIAIKQIAEKLDIRPNTVIVWRDRFLEEGGGSIRPRTTR